MSHGFRQLLAVMAAVIIAAACFPIPAFAEEAVPEAGAPIAEEKIDAEPESGIPAEEGIDPVPESGIAAEEGISAEPAFAVEPELEDLMTACDSQGEEIPLEELDASEYDGFIYGICEDAGEPQIREMEQKIDAVGDAETVEEICDGQLYKAASLAVIEEVVDPALVDFIEPDYIIRPESCNDTYYYENEWMYNVLGAPNVWNAGITGAGKNGCETPVVAVIDTGIVGWTKHARRHEDLNYKNFPTAYSSTSFKSCNDNSGHGTFVTGEIAAVMNNSKGITGLMPDAKIIPVKIMTSSGGKTSAAIAALKTLINRGDVDVVNMSFGSNHYSRAFASVCKKAARQGMILVAAAGNNGTKAYNYPASYAGVISVGSVNKYENKSAYSQHNPAVDVAAPGERIVGLGGYDSNNKFVPTATHSYCRMSGTSMSAPVVSALAAMAKSMDSSIEHNQFMDILMATSKDRGTLGHDNAFGWGIVSFSSAADYISAGSYSDVTRCDSGELTGETGNANAKVPKRPHRGKILKVKAGRTKAQIKYKYLNGATYYQLDIRLRGGRYSRFQTYSNVVKIVGMAPGRSYQVRVRGVHLLKGKKYYGKWSKVKSFRTK